MDRQAEGAPLGTTRRSRRVLVQQLTSAVAVGLLTGCAPVFPAGSPPRVRRVGVLWYGPDLAPELPHLAAFRKGLSDLGYVEGQNLTFEWRYGEQNIDRLAELADELVRLRVDVLFTPGLLATRAAKQATATLPIAGITNDPVAMGLVDSLARPGGNVTGVATFLTALAAKRVEVFKEAAPSLTRIAVLWNPLIPDKAVDVAETRSAAAASGMDVQPFEIRYASDVDGAFVGVTEWHADGIVTLLDPYTVSFQPEVAGFARANRLPTMCEGSGFVMLRGGLMSYGPDPFTLFDRAASYVDRILKGARPADLPVEQPTRVELALNLQTAQAIGVTFPQSILSQADKVAQ